MLAVPKLAIPDNLPGRMAAWWDGTPYVPPPPGEDDDIPRERPIDARLSALEALWGQGRFNPTNADLLSRVREAMLMPQPGYRRRIGFINVDPAHILAIAGDQPIFARAFDNRRVCVQRTGWQFQEYMVKFADVDRTRFDDESLDEIFSQDAVTFADHKSGLATRVFKALKPGGRWLVLDYAVPNADADLQPAFANAWSEPQLSDSNTLVDVAETVGLELPEDPVDVSGDLVNATQDAFARLGGDLSVELSQDMDYLHKGLFLQEIAWEAEAWKWRMKALSEGLLEAKLWRFKKPGELVVERAPQPTKDDKRAAGDSGDDGEQKSVGSFAEMLKKS